MDLGTALQLTYAWIKAAHVIFVIFWIAGLFMLPRFYVYHQEALRGSEEEQRWVDRERKLRTIILNPAMVLVWILGLTLASLAGAWSDGWLHAKLLIVLALVRLPWLHDRLRQEACSRPAPEQRQGAQDHERGARNRHRADRHPGDREAVLTT
jgi:uncharacterized integral membrane protein (TIGR00701 family)